MAKKSATKPIVWILMGLLILGLGGFGATNLGGSIRSIGSVGDVDIGVDEYFSGLQQEIYALQSERGETVRFSEARALGISERVLTGLIASAAFDHEAQQMGLSIGDENLRDEILSMQQFRGIDGSFDREVYSFALENAGLTEGQFEARVRADTARNLLQAAILAGVATPESYTKTMADYLGERRDVSWAVLDQSDISTGLPVPSDADLAQFHTQNEALFTTPESKRIIYAWLTPDMIVDTVEVDEAALRDAYEARVDDFNRPERRLLERLVFGSEDDARAALERINAGEATFEEIVEDRGLELADIDMGDVDRESLGDLADPIFAADVGATVGPLNSSLGPALFRINAILSEQITSFQDAQPLLRTELAADRARRVVDQLIDTVDDLLVGGATVEDVAQETELQLGQIDWHPDVTDDIAAYEAFRSAAAQITASDYPDVAQLEDDGIFTMQLEEVVPPAVQPLNEIEDQVRAAWNARAVAEALRAQAEPLVVRLQSGEGFEEVGLSIDGAQALTRRALQTETPADFISTVFDMEPGDAAVIEGDGQIFVLKLDAVLPPDSEDEELQELQILLENQAAAGLSQDFYNIMANDLRTRAGVNLDQSAINAVHLNFN